MKLIDISLNLNNDLPSWPGDPPPEIKQIHSIQEGATSNVTHLSITAHTGTHVDAPDHFLNDGRGVGQIPLDLLVGPAVVVELPEGDAVTPDMLADADIPAHTRRVLLKTPNSQLWAKGTKEFQKDFMGLSADAAKYLVSREVEVVGVDYLSVSPYTDPVDTHRILLEKDILIIEGLDLSAVDPGDFTMYCLPLKIEGADGAPARVLLGHG